LKDPADLRQPKTIFLVESAKEGSQEAWERLYHRYHGYLEFIVEMKIPDYARRRFNAEDVLQSAFLSAWRKIDSFDYNGEGSLLRWLSRIVVNDVRNRVRSILRERDRMQVESTAFPTDGAPAEGGMPDESAEEAESREAAARAFVGLDADDQHVLALRFGQDMKWDDVGEVLGCSRNAARHRFEQALGRLQRLTGRPPADRA